MEIIGCGKGHYYNPELYSSCPECAKENGGADFLGATEPVDFGNYANNFGNVGSTEPVNFGGFAGGGNVGKTEPVGFGGFAGGSSDVGKTEPVGFGGFAGGSAGNNFAGGAAGGFGGMMSTTDFRGDFSDGGNNSGGSKVQDYEPTMFAGSASSAGHGSVPFMPVVGWLVCIDGPAKGRDYRIHSQYNYIGRANHMDICISGDNCISAERHAVIAYDPKKRVFTFAPGGMSLNLIYINGETLMSPVKLNAFDQLTIGETELIFIPLCGERFDWNDK